MGRTIAHITGIITNVDIGQVPGMKDDDTFSEIKLTKKWFKQNPFKLSARDDKGKPYFLVSYMYSFAHSASHNSR